MRKIIFLLPVIFVLISCSSTTYIKTIPPGAKVYEGDAFMGVTPYMHWDIDSGDPGTSDYPGRTFTLRKEGFKDKTVNIKRNILNVPRLFFPAPIFSLPWAYDYQPEYYFELEPSGKHKAHYPPNLSTKKTGTVPDDRPYSAHARKLRELKQLYDEGLLSDEEYEQKRQSIIDDM